MLKMILLGFLNYNTHTGYDLKRLIEQSINNFWNAYHSQIYTTLRKMEQEGLVTSDLADDDDKLNKRVYTITAAGQAELHQWLQKPMQHLPTTKNEFMVRVFFSGQRDDDSIIAELRLHRQMHQERLEAYRAYDMRAAVADFADDVDAPHIQREMLFWQMTLEYGIDYEEMVIRSIDKMLAKLEGQREATHHEA